METTTIQLKKSTKSKLDTFKINPRESMDSLIERLMNMATDDEPLSDEEIKGIEKGLADIKAGRVYTTKQLEKKLGIK